MVATGNPPPYTSKTFPIPHASNGRVNAPPVISTTSPAFSPRRLIGRALAALKPLGSVTVTLPAVPDCSHRRRIVPVAAGSGLGQKAITRMPGRESAKPVETTGNAPAGSSLYAANTGWRNRQAGV